MSDQIVKQRFYFVRPHPLNVALRKTEVENPLLPRVILTSKKEKLLFCSKSKVNFKFLCLLFI